MKTITAIALAVGAVLSIIEPASAREPVPARYTPSGSAVCPSNYQYANGWCYWVLREENSYYRDRDEYRGEHRDRHRPGYYSEREGYGETEGYAPRVVPPQWNYQGSAVCPSNYEYVVGMNACVSVY
jgi:hypothetical protein